MITVCHKCRSLIHVPHSVDPTHFCPACLPKDDIAPNESAPRKRKSRAKPKES